MAFSSRLQLMTRSGAIFSDTYPMPTSLQLLCQRRGER
jgi:hypothetical protein